MSDIRFADVMHRERERLHRERDEVLNQQKELENKLTEIISELVAIDAYEAAKTGRVTAAGRRRRSPGASGTSVKQLSTEPRPHVENKSRREGKQ